MKVEDSNALYLYLLIGGRLLELLIRHEDVVNREKGVSLTEKHKSDNDERVRLLSRYTENNLNVVGLWQCT